MKYSFSTEVVDLDNQAPNRNKRESKYFWDELNRLMAAGGFHSIEIPYEPKWDFGGRSGIPRTLRSVTIKFGSVEKYRAYLRENGIEAIDSIHFNPSLFCQGALTGYFEAVRHYGREAVGFAKEADCKVVTLSAAPPHYAVSKLLDGAPAEEFVRGTKELISALAAAAEAAGVTLCLKNEFWGLFRGGAVTELLDELDGVKLDLDTANLQIAGADIAAVIEANKERIGIVHFTDTSFLDEDETWKTALPEFPAGRATKVFTDLGEGGVDFRAVSGKLAEAGYDGVVVLNPRNSFDISRSILRTRYFVDHALAQ